MKKLLFIISIGVFIFSGCSNKEKQAGGKTFSTENKMNIVATIGMIGDVAQELGGERTAVYSLMGSGIDPHLYKAKARDVERLSKADLILYNGLHLEAKMGEILEKLSETRNITAVAETIPETRLIEVEQGAHDPHVWFDVQKWREAAKNILNALIASDAPGKEYYTGLFNEYDKKLVDLDTYVKSRAAFIPEEKRILITAHDAFNYFGQAYGFKVLGLQGISTVDEAGTGDIRDLADFIADNKIAAIFVETSVSSKGIQALQAAVKDRGFEVNIGGELFSDAMGSPGTPEGTYLGMVRHNIDTIVSGLTGSGE